MVDPVTGALCEQYAPDWTPRPDADVEPGHQLEWGWLLLRHARHAGRPDPAAARRLIEIGETRGVERSVAISSLGQDLLPRDRSARLWAQTERLHAHAMACRWADIPPTLEGLNRFLAVAVQGTWRDRLLPDGSFVEEAAPATSLYHIVSAAAALDSACAPAR
jgi:mannose-6-phosphate isomerase